MGRGSPRHRIETGHRSQPGIIWPLGKLLSDLNPFARAIVLGVAALVVVIIGGFGVFRMLGAGSVLGDVRVLGLELGGLDETELTEQLELLETELTGTPIVVEIDGTNTDITGAQIGATLANDLVEQALAVGRDGGMLSQFGWWIVSLRSNPTELVAGFGVSDEQIDQLADSWDTDLIATTPFPGAIEILGGMAEPRYPITGITVEREGLSALLTSAILGEQAEPVSIPTRFTSPGASDADIDAATALAQRWISNSIVLTTTGGTFEVDFTQLDLANAFRSQVDMDGVITLAFDENIIESLLLNRRGDIEEAPVDARMEIDGYDVVITPGRNGTLIDSAATTAVLESLAAGSLRRGTLPFVEGAEPEVTTDELEALGIEHMVVQFTTYHDCCAARVTNIQLMADTIDGHIVEAGETFGINDFVGQRTEADGYREAGSIVRGEIVESVGGGVSQFATTLYNAVFWGGYEDIQHKPHSFYFSRYPEGIESTVSYPAPELSFRNNTESALMLKTSYTDTSITVRIYGANDGRILAGTHRRGSTSFETVAEGGPDAKVVSGRVSDRTDPTEPTTEYRENPEVLPGEQNELQGPRAGWTVVVTRTIEQNGEETSERWTVRYLAQRQILEVNPCEMPDSEMTCPTTTTTTLPEESTTTTEPG